MQGWTHMFETKNAIITMTALIPTTGHSELIKFAANLPNTTVYVLVNGRTKEPIPSLDRWRALNKHFEHFPNVIIHNKVSDDAPQNEWDTETPQEFWDWWTQEINGAFPRAQNKWDYVIASEIYGIKLATALGATFVPYDIERSFNPVKGTDVRNDIWTNWDGIIPEFRQQLAETVVMFGQESVGKTTLSKMVAEKLQVEWFPEYARPYLEAVGAEVTETAMSVIHHGQASLQKLAINNAKYPVTVLDTDLFSTVGYYGIYYGDNGATPPPQDCVTDAIKYKAHVYYVLPDDIPFEEDILRYGGDVRESDRQYWIRLLEQYDLYYKLVPSGTAEEKTNWIANDIKERFNNKVEPIKSFIRD